VSQRIKLIRDALDDDPKQPRYIAGVRGCMKFSIAHCSAPPRSVMRLTQNHAHTPAERAGRLLGRGKTMSDPALQRNKDG
jgi:hypothetical protein